MLFCPSNTEELSKGFPKNAKGSFLVSKEKAFLLKAKLSENGTTDFWAD